MSRQYLNASRAVEAVIEQHRSLSSYCAKKPLGKTEFALVSETLRHRQILDFLFDSVGISAESMEVRYGLALVIAYELFFGKKKIQGGGAVKRKLKEFEISLKGELDNMIENIQSYPQFVDVLGKDKKDILKYARVNEIKITKDEIIQTLKSQNNNFDIVSFDEFIPSLLVLKNCKGGLGDNELVKNSSLIIQDKSSCFPSQVLGDIIESEYRSKNEIGDVIDTCSAPGNKTSHLASIIHTLNLPKKKKMKVFAFEKNNSRFNLLTQRMKDAGADNIVETFHCDFLTMNPLDNKYKNVKYFLIDPSCSGSGLNSIERIAEGSTYGNNNSKNEDNSERLKKLSEFQFSVIKHAMQFPSVKYLVYSTCSIHSEENESVVEKVLSSEPFWELYKPNNFNNWTRRGETFPGLTNEQLSCLLRCSPHDNTSGFFVSAFKKKEFQTNNRIDNHLKDEVKHEIEDEVDLTKKRKRMSEEDILKNNNNFRNGLNKNKKCVKMWKKYSDGKYF